MATSGSFNTNKEGNFYCTVSWSRTGYDATKNEHYIKYSVVAHNTAGKYRSVYTKELTINGSRVYYNTTSKNLYDGDTVTSGNITIKSSNAAGDGSLTMSFKAGVGTSQSTNISGSQTWSLNRIPRYATSNQTVASKTETSININWSSDSIIDGIWYSINNGSSWNWVNDPRSTSGSYTISGLAANTTYNIKTRVKRYDSQLTTDSSSMAVATYAYPYANSMPSFTIGEGITINFYNPLARNMSIEVIAQDNSIIQSFTMTGNTVYGFSGEQDKARWYASIPNSKTGTYKVKVTYAGHVETRTGGTYQVNVNECFPNTGTFTYQDTKASTVAITENNQLIIQNQSTLQINVTGAGAKKSATLIKASVNINGVITNANFAAGSTSLTINIGAINVANNINVPITITDSRGISSTANLTIQVLAWSLPNAIISLARVSNYYTTTNLNVNANYSSLNNKNTITIQYQIKKVTDANYGNLVTIQDDIPVQFEADNLYEWDVRIILTDRLGATTYNLRLGKGIPIVFFDRNKRSTGFNCFPTENESVVIEGAGGLLLNNKNTYDAIRKTRTVNGVDYKANVGLSAAPSTRMELKDANDNLIGQLDIRTDGHIWNGKNNRRLPEVAYSAWDSSFTFSLTGGHALVITNQNDCLILWVAGARPDCNVVRLLGNGVQVSFDADTKMVTLKYQDNHNFTGTAFIATG